MTENYVHNCPYLVYIVEVIGLICTCQCWLEMTLCKSSLIVTKNELCNYETIVWKKTEGLENLHFWNFNFQNQQDGS